MARYKTKLMSLYPNKKKADKELKAGADKLDDGGGEARSLANVDESGNVIFRSATRMN